ncbi:MAG: tRNA 2-thiouridine(34) synthase MnmA [Clostridia bacterium]|nr:tRNA 2-thiouridine(34) synthase MnmA [Clostridia bacterium]
MSLDKVLVGMSGGVDSSAATLILKQNGYETAGVTLRLWEGEKCGSSNDILDAAAVCKKLGIEHYVFDLKKQFEASVINKFISEYKAGNTPNPCIECNKHIKFGEMLNIAVDMGFSKIATGHYATIKKQGDRFVVVKPKDKAKDQSYVLYSLTQHQLSHTVMPLGELTKAEVRFLAEQNSLITAHKSDSQDICFVPDGDYADFISKRLGVTFPEGDYVDVNGNVIGRHKGMIRYTIGQRKGLGMCFGKPMYVLDKSPSENKVILGDEEKLFKTRVLVKDVNYMATERLLSPIDCLGKLRYRHTEQPCRIIPLDENTLLAEFTEPQRAPTAGQAAVFYDGDTVICGGVIDTRC